MNFTASFLNLFPNSTIAQTYLVFGTFELPVMFAPGTSRGFTGDSIIVLWSTNTSNGSIPATVDWDNKTFDASIQGIPINTVATFTIVYNKQGAQPPLPSSGTVSNVTVTTAAIDNNQNPINNLPIVIDFTEEPIPRGGGGPPPKGALAPKQTRSDEVPNEHKPTGKVYGNPQNATVTSFMYARKPGNGNRLVKVPETGLSVELTAATKSWKTKGDKPHDLKQHKKGQAYHFVEVIIGGKKYYFSRTKKLNVKE